MFGIPHRILFAGLGALAILAAVWFYGHTRYRAGVAAADAKWAEASKQLEIKASTAATAADRASAGRVAGYTERLAIEKEQLDEAEETGSSPLDVLFGP